MSDPFELQRFITAQEKAYDSAIGELRAGAKESHWMWFIFPQLRGLGRSHTSKYFGIASLEEARAYLGHALLGARLRESVEALLTWEGRTSAERIFGSIDALKLRSSLTLFDRVEPDALFAAALSAFFADERDHLTLALLNEPS